MPPTEEIYEAVNVASRRIATYATSIQQAHQLGHGPGVLDELWEREYQEKAMQVYTRTIPWSYLVNLAGQFGATAQHMVVAATPRRIADEWYVITEYLRNTADVILAFAPPADSLEPSELEPTTPSVMEFAQLGEIASALGAERLRSAGAKVAIAAASMASPLNQEQADLLQLLIDGKSLLQAGEALGYSTRSIQRKLTKIQAELGVTTRQEAIALVSANGWLQHTTRTDPLSA